jgi:hypothetical protein
MIRYDTYCDVHTQILGGKAQMQMRALAGTLTMGKDLEQPAAQQAQLLNRRASVCGNSSEQHTVIVYTYILYTVYTHVPVPCMYVPALLDW